MKEFFKKHSYDMVKMFLNQFGIAILGMVLALATAMAENNLLKNVTSIGAILFYLFLLYTMTWEIGYKDKLAVEQGRKVKNVFTGSLISLCANVPNFIFAIFITLATFVGSEESIISSIGGVCSFLAMSLEGMYTGILSNHVGGAPLNSYWFVYFLLPIPAMITCGISYYLGLKDIKFTSLFDPIPPESDRDPAKKKKTWRRKE